MADQHLPGADLNYAPRPQSSRRRWVRVAAVLLLCAAAVAAWWWRGDIKAGAATAKMLYAQRRCMTFDAPTGLVAYEEDAARAQALLGQPHWRRGIPAAASAVVVPSGSLGFRAVLPASWNTAPQTAGGLWAAQPELGSFHAERRLRILAGRPDPNDPSRFTIEYETRRGRGRVGHQRS
jgi:hypothetical protein